MTGTVVCTTVTVRTTAAHCGGARRSHTLYVTLRGPSTRVLMGRPVTTIEAVKLPSKRSNAVQPRSWQQGERRTDQRQGHPSDCLSLSTPNRFEFISAPHHIGRRRLTGHGRGPVQRQRRRQRVRHVDLPHRKAHVTRSVCCRVVDLGSGGMSICFGYTILHKASSGKTLHAATQPNVQTTQFSPSASPEAGCSGRWGNARWATCHRACPSQWRQGPPTLSRPAGTAPAAGSASQPVA